MDNWLIWLVRRRYSASSWSGQLSGYKLNHRNFISCTFLHLWTYWLPLNYVTLMYIFQMAAILVIFLCVSAAYMVISLKPSYTAQLCFYTGATHTEVIMQLWPIFLKLWGFFSKKNLHFALFEFSCAVWFEILYILQWMSHCAGCIYVSDLFVKDAKWAQVPMDLFLH